MVALEALSAYSIQTLNTASTDLTVRLGTPGRQNYYSIVLTDALEGFQKQLEVYNHWFFKGFFPSKWRNQILWLGFVMLSNHDVADLLYLEII